ncbi:MAG: glyoxalase [Flavobacterium sp. BFFFF2]|nr:MAG: glyoxalase [Flavobacterium sp. BFFFF2]
MEFQSVSPNLYVSHLATSMYFYTQLGFSATAVFPEGDEPIFAMMQNNGVTILLQTIDSLGDDLPEIPRQRSGAILLYFQVNKIRELAEKVGSFTAILKPLETTFYGATEFSVVDPDGFVLTFAEDE